MTGSRTPSPFQEQMRRLGHALPYNTAGKKAASLLLRLAGGTSGKAFDVPVFGSQKARLHPYDNISEKRVYITPQFWDPAERAFLKAYIASTASDGFIFADIGANAGMYSLFTLSACLEAGKHARIVAVEPDPLMRERMDHNVSASGADDKVTLLPWAITAEHLEVHLELNETSRGMNRLRATPGTGRETVTVDGHPLADIFEATHVPRIDAMKIDIEGAEYPALQAFFASAETWQKPALFIIETSHEEETSALCLCLDNGYEVVLQNNLNSILLKK